MLKPQVASCNSKRFAIKMAWLKEGSAKIQRLKEVFYNPHQAFNRDITMLVADTYARRLQTTAPQPFQGISVLEPLAGTGIRSIRYYKELTVPITRLLANDLCPEAVGQIKRNFILNEVVGDVSGRDACDLMYSHRNDQWDIIDLDPYGTVAPFIDAALQSVKEGGLLCLTSTDMATLCGAHVASCFSKYGSVPTHNAHCHEFALRILLHTLNSAATKYQRVVTPLLSLSVDFYVRLFVQVTQSAKQAEDSILRPALVLQCEECPSIYLQHIGRKPSKGKSTSNNWTTPAVCKECGSPLLLGGPIHSGPIHSKGFIDELMQSLEEGRLTQLSTKARLKAVLSQVNEELELPLAYSLPEICKLLKASTPPQRAFKSALRSLGFEVSQSHTSDMLYKTNAPPEIVFDIVKSWVKDTQKVRQGSDALRNIMEGTPAWRILTSRPCRFDIDFDQDVTDADTALRLAKRVPVLPPNWGPGCRPKKSGECEAD